MDTSCSIKKLSEEVVNRIAAGEVIQRPANAVKEMLENSLDAKSTSITITLKEGGLKFLQIQDNGTGIKKTDMNIVCERFTTSKLTRFEDLTHINTYGFRGEALASITHVAHVTITSKTQDSLCAYKGSYRDSKLTGNLTNCAANNGTQITVEDMFYNVPLRRQALKSPSEEHRRVVDVVARYAIHNPAVEFVVKKHGSTMVDLKTPQNSTNINNIAILHGLSLSKELLEVKGEKLGVKVHGWVTNANYSSKKHTFVLFINHRSVENSDLKKVLESCFAAYLPKNSYPFVYLSLEMDGRNVDVNIHPTKSEVHFLNEDEIINMVQLIVDARLLECNHSRTFYTQTLLPIELRDIQQSQEDKSSIMPTRDKDMVRTDSKSRKIQSYLLNDATSAGKKADGCCVGGGVGADSVSGGMGGDGGGFYSGDNTDKSNIFCANDCNIVMNNGEDSLMVGTKVPCDDEACLSGVKVHLDFKENGDANTTCNDSSHKNHHKTASKDKLTLISKSSSSSSSSSFTSIVGKRRQLNLTSILELKKEIERGVNIGLKEMVGELTWVGVVDTRWILTQYNTKLFLVKYPPIIQEFFYQLFVSDFGNFGVIRLSQPAPLHDLATLALEHPSSGWKESDGSRDDLALFVVQLLVSKAPLLWDYFSVEIDSKGNLRTLPLVLNNFIPCLHFLPFLVLRLSTEVDWDKEKSCFDSLCREFSRFYAITPEKDEEFKSSQEVNAEDKENMNEKNHLNDLFSLDDTVDAESLNKIESLLNKTNDNSSQENEPKTSNLWRKHIWTLEHVVFEALKKHILPPGKLSTMFLQVADLPSLYKVFERC